MSARGSLEDEIATVYVNRYYERTGNDITTSYYLGNKTNVALVRAQRKGINPNYTLSYVLQDHLGSTTVTTDSGGDLIASMKYYPIV
jgi:hypothetical protein